MIMVKYLIINGSPRKKNSYNIVKEVKTNLNGEFEEIHLIKQDIPMCNGCMKCIEEGENHCPHSEKIKVITDKIRECDGLIITSPVYALNVSALLKNLFDHTAYLYHRPEFFSKKALIIVTAAGTGQKKVAKYIDETLRHLGFNKTYKIAIACGGKDSIDSKYINPEAIKFKKDLESGKLHSPKFKDILYYNIWRALASSKNPIKADAQYWTSTSMIDYDYAPVIKLGIIKKLFSKIMFLIFKQIFK